MFTFPRARSKSSLIALTISVLLTTSYAQRTGTTSNTWSSGSPMPLPLVYTMTAVLDGRIYVVGGYNNDAPADFVQIYNPATDKWREGVPLPTRLYAGTAAVYKRVLYVFGGTNAFGEQTNQVWAFDVSTNAWSSKSPMPTPRSSIGAVVGDSLILVIGGYQGGLRLNTVEAYDPTTDTWAEEPPLLVGKTEPSVGEIGRFVVVADGYTSSGDTGDTEFYDQFSGNWYPLPPDPTPRNSACTGSINSKMYISGGFPGGGPGTPAINLVESLDGTKTWVTLAPMPQATLEAGAAVYDGLLYCIGGWQAAYGTINNNVQIYHP